jgi:hypothetical protein
MGTEARKASNYQAILPRGIARLLYNVPGKGALIDIGRAVRGTEAIAERPDGTRIFAVAPANRPAVSFQLVAKLASAHRSWNRRPSLLMSPVPAPTEGVLQAMCFSKSGITVALLAGAVLASAGPLTQPALAEKAPQASKIDLTPETFPKLHALIKPQDHEWRHLRVQWLTDPVAALKKATAEDKPIVFLYLGGAGYNAPLGIC